MISTQSLLSVREAVQLLFHSLIATFIWYNMSSFFKEYIASLSSLKVRKPVKLILGIVITYSVYRSYLARVLVVSYLTFRGILVWQFSQQRCRIMVSTQKISKAEIRGSNSGNSNDSERSTRSISRTPILWLQTAAQSVIKSIQKLTPNYVQSHDGSSQEGLTPDTPAISKRLFSFRTDSGEKSQDSEKNSVKNSERESERESGKDNCKDTERENEPDSMTQKANTRVTFQLPNEGKDDTSFSV